MRPGVVSHTYNPSYLGGIEKQDGNSRPTLANCKQNPTSTNKLSVLLYIFNSWEAIGRRITV
jgi:hypothetical protein